MPNIRIIENVFTEEEIQELISNQESSDNEVIRDKIAKSFDLESFPHKIPVRVAKSDMQEHVDTQQGSSQFKHTYLYYLNDSPGNLVIAGESYEIKKNRGYIFEQGLTHSVTGTHGEPRYMIGPMNENGREVGVPLFTITNVSKSSGYPGDSIQITLLLQFIPYEIADTPVIVSFGSTDVSSTIYNRTNDLGGVIIVINTVVPNGSGNVDLSVTIQCQPTETTDYQPITSDTFTFSITPIPISNACFIADTLVRTDQGIMPIQNVDATKNTIHQMPIVVVTRTQLQDRFLICIEKDALGLHKPCKKTVVSPLHKIFYRGQMMESYRLLHLCRNVRKVENKGAVLYNILQKEPGSMVVNNMIFETLDPKHPIAAIYRNDKLTQNEKDYLIVNYNRAICENDIHKFKRVMKRFG